MMGHQEVRCNHFPLDLAVASVDHGPCTWERKDLACREPSHEQQGVIRACCCRATVHPRPRCAPSSRSIILFQTICRTILNRRIRCSANMLLSELGKAVIAPLRISEERRVGKECVSTCKSR